MEGAGRLEAFGSADPKSIRSYDDAEWETYDGYAMAVLRAGEEGGTIKAVITADGCATQHIEIEVQKEEGDKNEKRGKYNYLRCGHRLVEPDAVRLRAFVKPPSDFKWTKPDGMVVKLGYADTAGLIHSAKEQGRLT